MPAWRVEGLHRESGERTVLIVDATSLDGACHSASCLGVVADVSATKPVEAPEAPRQPARRRQPLGWIIPTVIAGASLIIVAALAAAAWRAYLVANAPRPRPLPPPPLVINGLTIPPGFAPPVGRPAPDNSMIAEGVQLHRQSIRPTIRTPDGQAWRWEIVVSNFGRPLTTAAVTAVWSDQSGNAITWSQPMRILSFEGQEVIEGRWWLPDVQQRRVASVALWFEPLNQ